MGTSADTGYSTSAESSAQAEAPPPPPPPPPPVAPMASEPMTQTAPPADDGRTDHQRVVGGTGVGLLSATELQTLLPGPDYTLVPLAVPVVGIRHWFDEGMGFQIGLGLNTSSGTLKSDIAGDADVDLPTVWGLALHGGLPFSLYSDTHYNLVLVPELNLGYATGRTKDDANLAGDQGVKHNAWLVGLALKIGAEVQFGMIDLPMLALQATVGAELNYRSATADAAENGVIVTRRRWGLDASTASFNDPWDLFSSSIAALYYFQ